MAAGFGFGLRLHLGGQLILALAAAAIWGAETAKVPSLFLGWTQLLYMIPAIDWCRLRGRRRAASMLTIMTTVAFIVNSACAALVLTWV
jgi:hypothetical protein